MNYNVISTGSMGNAVVIENKILIDCGVSYKLLLPYISNLKLVLLTHIHCDHFNKSTIRKLAAERPTLRFGCGKWLVRDLIACKVPKWRIDVYGDYSINHYSRDLTVAMFPLNHNVPNCGYKISIDNERLFYATDTNDLNGIKAKNYDLYMVEANYEDEEIQERIREKELRGEYAYEYQVLKNHLSKAKCDDFLIKNAGPMSEFVYMHGHIGGKNE